MYISKEDDIFFYKNLSQKYKQSGNNVDTVRFESFQGFGKRKYQNIV